MSQDDLIFDRTQEDVDNRRKKGFYMAADLNRVCGAAQEIAGFSGLPISFKTDWTPYEFPTAQSMRDYLKQLSKLRGWFAVFKTTPDLPDTMKLLAYQSANDIEKMLADMQEIKEIIPANWPYCGEFLCGEVYP